MSRNAWRLGNPVVRSYANQATQPADDEHRDREHRNRGDERPRPPGERAADEVHRALLEPARRPAGAEVDGDAWLPEPIRERDARPELCRHAATEPLDYPSLAGRGANGKARLGLSAQVNPSTVARMSCLSPQEEARALSREPCLTVSAALVCRRCALRVALEDRARTPRQPRHLFAGIRANGGECRASHAHLDQSRPCIVARRGRA